MREREARARSACVMCVCVCVREREGGKEGSESAEVGKADGRDVLPHGAYYLL